MPGVIGYKKIDINKNKADKIVNISNSVPTSFYEIFSYVFNFNQKIKLQNEKRGLIIS